MSIFYGVNQARFFICVDIEYFVDCNERTKCSIFLVQ